MSLDTVRVPVPALAVTVPLTGWVACQKVPVTGVDGIDAIETGCVACQKVPETGCVDCQNVPVTGVEGIEARETGCVDCQKVPETGKAPDPVAGTTASG